MTEPLHLKYRPAQFSEMVGQRLTAVVLDKMVANGKVPSGLLFTGPSGTGKTTAARILAHTLSPDVDPTLAVIEIDAASNGGVADVRSLTESLRYSNGSQWRVVILDEAHSMSRDAFNALLKTLEEPPTGTIFVLVTTEPHKIPETVSSRLMEFEFRRVAPADIFDRLVAVSTAEGLTVGVDVLQRIAYDADGSVRSALMSLEKADLADLLTIEDYLAATSTRDVSARVLLSLAHGNQAVAFQITDAALAVVGHPAVLGEQVTRCLRDVLVIRSGGAVTASGKALEDRHTLVSLLEVERIFAAIRIVWDLKTKVRASEDPRGSLDLALALIGEVFTRGRVAATQTAPVAVVAQPSPVESVPAAAPAAEPRKITLAEMGMQA